MTIHIPDEVIEAAETAYAEAMSRMGFSRETMRAAIAAGLEAWPKTGMARNATLVLSEPNVWETYSGDDVADVREALVIRTESP